MIRKTLLAPIGLLLVTAAGMGGGPAADAGEGVKVGAVVPLTGRYGALGGR